MVAGLCPVARLTPVRGQPAAGPLNSGIDISHGGAPPAGPVSSADPVPAPLAPSRTGARSDCDRGVTVSRSTTAPSPQAPPELELLDPLLQHRARLGALVLLSGTDYLSFSRLKALLDETDGNLGAQLRRLEEARYVSVSKEFVNRRPTSWYAITAAGRRATPGAR